MTMTLAALNDCVDWDMDKPGFALSPTVEFCPATDHAAYDLYQRLCWEQGFDGGEPLDHVGATLILMRPSTDLGPVSADLDRLLNLMVVVFRQPLYRCTTLRSGDNFKTARGTDLLFENGEQDPTLEREFPLNLTERKAKVIASRWRTAQRLWAKARSHSRVHTALRSFNCAWRSPDLASTILHLAKVVTVLFGTDDEQRVAARAARFCDGGEADLEKLLNVRRAMLAGSPPPFGQLDCMAPQWFERVARILGKVLKSDKTAARFDNEAAGTSTT